MTESRLSSNEQSFHDLHDGPNYRVPVDLRVSPNALRKVLLIGACLLDSWPAIIERLPTGCPCERILFNHTRQLQPEPPQPITDYDFQVISIPFRSVLPEATYLTLGVKDSDAYRKAFDAACDRLTLLLEQAMRWNVEHKILTFVTNFFVPQQNALGRLLDRYELRNPVYFVERLNEHFVRYAAKYTNCQIIDIDQIASSFGKKFIQDDAICVGSHNSVLTDYDFGLDQARIVPTRRMSDTYQFKVTEFVGALWDEVVAGYRTLKQIDSVKMVVVDLDDTLWRGVLAESEVFTGHEVEGWPLGVIEALTYLKKRGILLAIVSKNDEEKIRGIWSKPMGGRLDFKDFAFIRINWKTKAENIRDILALANLLPRNTLFIDDNPVERAAVQAELPDIRAIGADPYYLKRILLWSAETQVALISDESSRRTELIQQQVKREETRKALTREEFLASLKVQVELSSVPSLEDKRVPRMLELINKTNQFNTTGQRWSQEALLQAFKNDNKFWVFSVSDVYSDYGQVGAVIVGESDIFQFVMSCRVLGMDIELAIIASLINQHDWQRSPQLSATMIETTANGPCRDLYERAGFVKQDERWVYTVDMDTNAATAVRRPEHVSLTIAS